MRQCAALRARRWAACCVCWACCAGTGVSRDNTQDAVAAALLLDMTYGLGAALGSGSRTETCLYIFRPRSVARCTLRDVLLQKCRSRLPMPQNFPIREFRCGGFRRHLKLSAVILKHQWSASVRITCNALKPLQNVHFTSCKRLGVLDMHAGGLGAQK